MDPGHQGSRADELDLLRLCKKRPGAADAAPFHFRDYIEAAEPASPDRLLALDFDLFG
jgi:hypothetical protein